MDQACSFCNARPGELMIAVSDGVQISACSPCIALAVLRCWNEASRRQDKRLAQAEKEMRAQARADKAWLLAETARLREEGRRFTESERDWRSFDEAVRESIERRRRRERQGLPAEE
jgi:hypothetical protein